MIPLNNSSVEDLILFFISRIRDVGENTHYHKRYRDNDIYIHQSPDQDKVSYDMGVNNTLLASFELNHNDHLVLNKIVKNKIEESLLKEYCEQEGIYRFINTRIGKFESIKLIVETNAGITLTFIKMGASSELTATMENKTVYKASKEVSNKFNPIGRFPIKEYEKTIMELINQVVFKTPTPAVLYI